jgi:hypothetical protein
MKKVLFLLMLLTILGIVFSYAQCSKKQVITSGKTDYVDGNGNLQQSVDENTTIEYDKSQITITIGNQQGDTKVMNGTIKSDSCYWTVPYKQGKSIVKALLTDERGDTKNLTITIEGKEGKLTFLAEVQEMPDRKIRLTIDKFEEKK